MRVLATIDFIRSVHSMKQTLSFTRVLLPIILALSSCGDPPELVAKREQQRAEIARLKGELEIMEEKLRNMPPDVSEELDEARKKAEKQTAEISGLEAEIKELQARKRTLQAEFDSYRAKYQVK